ncbi:MAG: hypothetical protein ABIN94_22760 [Ferruginibacter sp.]
MLESVKKSFWDFKSYEENQWFKKLVQGLLFVAAVYIGLHLLINWLRPDMEYEYIKLDKDQMQQVSMIYLHPSDFRKADSIKSKKDSLSDSLGATSPSVGNDSVDSINKLKQQRLADDSVRAKRLFSKYQFSDSCDCRECTTEERIMCFLWNEFNHKLDTLQLRSVAQYLSCASTTEATGFLSRTRFKVQSYFWLIGPLVYLEIIFWTWLGVLCSLLFNLGVISRKSTTNPTDPTTYFDSSEIPSQVAKLLYAPVCTLIIILGYNFFTDENIVDISSSKGVLVFAFIGGFYSSRLISFLDRLKELLLPVSGPSGTQADIPPLRNIVVQVQLEENVKTLWDSLKIDLQSLKVTLQKEGSTQQAIALNIDTSQWPLFIFDFVQPGNYIIEAAWSTKINDKAANLQAKQRLEMKGADQSVVLKLAAVDSDGTDPVEEPKPVSPQTPVETPSQPNQPTPANETANADESTVEQPTSETPVDVDIIKKSEDND